MAKKKSTRKKTAKKKSVETLTHDEAKRSNIPTAELETVMEDSEAYSIEVAIKRRNPDLDPQLVWRGKDTKNWSDLVVNTPPLFIQEKVHPKVLIDDLKRRTETQEATGAKEQLDLFADFNGLPDASAKTEFYQHESNWTNRMILGDSLQVMASLAEREGLRGKVQCIFFDPPYGIRFNSNFQWSTTSRDVKDGKTDHLTREPEQVKAFRDTWKDGIHTYLDYLRDRLVIGRDLLNDSGSLFLQIGEENVHRVRVLLDEVFGDDNFVASIEFTKTSAGLQSSNRVAGITDTILWYSKSSSKAKYRKLLEHKGTGFDSQYSAYLENDGSFRSLTAKEKETFPGGLEVERVIQATDLTKPGPGAKYTVEFQGREFTSGRRWWGAPKPSLERAIRAGRIVLSGSKLRYARRFVDSRFTQLTNLWTGFLGQTSPTYVVQTNVDIVQRCILMATDPGDLVLDPTCGSGTTAFVAEQWGRRWITIDTSRVALALARSRIMGARYPYYLLSDSVEGQAKEASLSRKETTNSTAHDRIRLGFVYQRVAAITPSVVSNNLEIDLIHEAYAEKLDIIRRDLNASLNVSWEEWEVPMEPGERWKADAATAHAKVMKLRAELAATLGVLDTVELSKFADRVRDLIAKQAVKHLSVINGLTSNKFDFDSLPDEPRDPWSTDAKKLHAQWWKLRIERQKEIDASIAAVADFEYLYDKPFEDKAKVRVAGPFTVESLSPHRTLGVDENDELIDRDPNREQRDSKAGFATMVLENLKTAGVQQSHKEDRISFTSITPWPGEYVAATGVYVESDSEDAPEKKSAIFIGPEFGTVARADLVAAAREAADAGFDVLVACAFNYDAHSAEFDKLGKVPVLKARMNADLHMADELKNTGKGNLFVIFGEPDIDITPAKGDDAKMDQVQVKINGVDVFHPQTGEVRSDGADGIACWFIDTNYNEESFFVRHAYFLGAGDPYKSLKNTLKAEINAEAWGTLNSDTSRPFDKPKTGRIAVKVINHLGDEVMKVFRVSS